MHSNSNQFHNWHAMCWILEKLLLSVIPFVYVVIFLTGMK